MKKLFILLVFALAVSAQAFKGKAPHREKQTCYVFASVILQDRKAMAYTPVFTISVSDFANTAALAKLQNSVNSHLRAEGYKAYSSQGWKFLKKQEAEDYRSEMMIRDRNKGYDIIKTVHFTFTNDEE